MARHFYLLVLASGWIFAASAQATPCKIVVYNLNNYSLQGNHQTPPKSPAAFSAIETILLQLRPDVLAACEMGSQTDLSHLQQRLKKKGWDLPHTAWLDGPDTDRHLAILSRFPIERNDSRPLVLTSLRGHFVKRGILDITLRLEDDYALRVVGSHLKSQKPSSANGGPDSHQIRNAEAQSLAAHIRKILKSSPQSNLLVCGDLNDRPTSSILRSIREAHPPSPLFDLLPADSRGDRWTYHFAKDDVYSRYDYLLAGPGLVQEILEFGIAHNPAWNLASDHRPLYILISTAR